MNSDFNRPAKNSAWKLFKGKSTTHVDKVDSSDLTDKQNKQEQPSVPLVEALFLPDFPVRSKDSDFDVSTKIKF